MNQLTFSDFTVTAIDKVQVKQSDNDVGVIYPGDATGTNALIVSGNKLLVTDSDATLRPYVKNLYDRLNNMVYVPCSNIQTPETIQIRAGDIVTVTDGKREFVTWITSVKHSDNKCTFESVGSIVRNTTTAVNNAKYSAKHRVAEIQTNLDGISAKLGEYSTKSETESAISVAIDKIQLGITEKTVGDNLFDGGAWVKTNVENYDDGTTGQVILDGTSATLVAPDSTEPNKRSAAQWNIQSSKFGSVKGMEMTVSIEYKVNSEVSNQGHNSRIIFWVYYASGNVSTLLVDLYSPGSTAEPAGDWKVASAVYQFKEEVPTSIYMFAYVYGGTGSVSVRNPSLVSKSNKESVLSLTKDGVEISSSVLDLNAFTSNDEVRSRFAMDATSVTIESGAITFKGNTLAVDSDNFKLTKSGEVSITGSFTSSGTDGKAIISNGVITLDALNADGKRYPTVRLSRTIKSFPSGSLTVYSRRSDGTVGDGCVIQGSDTDSRIFLKNAYGGNDVFISSGENVTSYIKGNLDVKGVGGLGVSYKISCQNLSASQTLEVGSKIKPRSQQNALYTDWQYWKTINNESVWVLVGKGTPWS